MAELGFSRFPNIWDGAKLNGPGNEFDCGSVEVVLVKGAGGGSDVRLGMEVTADC